jgi:hypothetical protein
MVQRKHTTSVRVTLRPLRGTRSHR